jgi:RNA polymerase sigma-70 factor, ECF subfamily
MDTASTDLLDVNEQSLLAGVRDGDEDACNLLVRLHGGRMLAVARRMLGNEEDARDALQEAFLSAFKAVHRFEGKSKLGTWLHRITVNAALMRLRKHAHDSQPSIDDLLPRFIEDGHQAEPAIEWDAGRCDLAAQHAETRQLVRRAIDQLPESFREVLLLRDIEELDTDEVAEMLGVTTGAVKTRLHRARQALRALLDQHFRAGAL